MPQTEPTALAPERYQELYSEGRAAYCPSEARAYYPEEACSKDCPYPDGSLAAEAWYDGYIDAADNYHLSQFN